MRPEEKAAKEIIRTDCHSCIRQAICQFGDDECAKVTASVIARANVDHYLPLLHGACDRCELMECRYCPIDDEIDSLEAARKDGVE